MTAEKECARPRAQHRSITERVVHFQHLPVILACCARGRAHSADGGFRHLHRIFFGAFCQSQDDLFRRDFFLEERDFIGARC